LVRKNRAMSENTPESLVLDGCLWYLEIWGIYHWRNNTGAVQIRPRRIKHE
jgi:hypothetical protein